MLKTILNSRNPVARVMAAATVASVACLWSLGQSGESFTVASLARISRARLPERLGAVPRTRSLLRNWAESGCLSPFFRPPIPRVGQMRAILSTTYGITVTEHSTGLDLLHVLMFALAHRPDETRGLVFEFSADRIYQNGNLGEWVQGTAEINSDRADTVFHEGTHHILEFKRNSRGQRLGVEIHAAALKAGRGRIPDNCYSRDYAHLERKPGDYSEFVAELVTGIAGLEMGIPMETTIQNPAFDPPESVRAVVRQIWVPQPFSMLEVFSSLCR